MEARSPHWFVENFVGHANMYDITVSDEARSILLEFETTAHRKNVWPAIQILLIPLIEKVEIFRSVLKRLGVNPARLIKLAEDEIDYKGDKYHHYDDDLYSGSDLTSTRAIFGSSAISRLRFLRRKRLESVDLVAALFDTHEICNPIIDNYQWSDERLNSHLITLCHLIYHYHEDLWIPLSIIRRDLGIEDPHVVHREIIGDAPSHLRAGLQNFLADHSEYAKNCFLIMPFRPTRQLLEVHAVLRAALQDKGFNVLRADDAVYAENVFANIEIFMRGSRFAVSVHERLLGDAPNANVALEVGYMLGMKKEVCLLKDKSLATLPSDLQGRLYVEFDTYSIGESITNGISKWLADRKYLAS